MERLREPFETGRIRFRLLEERDFDVVYRQFSDPAMCRYFSEPPMDRDEAVSTIEMFQHPERDSYLRYGLFERGTGEFLGTCGYHHWDREQRQVELGYDIWRDYWRKGYATEALVPLLEICFRVLEADLVYVLIHRDNQGSISTARNAGFEDSEPCRPLDEPEQVCMKLTRTVWERLNS
ncbi:MAG: GNAT family N-acetyltransferase [Thermomicrobiaceae bacterium]